MIEILKVKREFLYLLLTLTQEKNVKVSRFPLIHLDETILAHTNLAEFRKFLQEAENEALLDRMVIVQVPYTLSYKEEARIYRKLVSSTQAFREVHLDPHALHVAAVFAVLTRLAEGEAQADNLKKARLYAGEDVEGVSQSQSEVEKMRQEPRRGARGGVAALRDQCALERDHPVAGEEPHHHERPDRAQGRDRLGRAHRQRSASGSISWSRAQGLLQPLGQGGRAQALFVSFEDEAQQLLDKYLDEVEATLDNRSMQDPITNEERKPDERFLRSVEEKIKISESGKLSFRQEVVEEGDGRLQARREVHARQPRAAARRDRAVSLRAAPGRAAPGFVGVAAGRGDAAEDFGGRETPGRRIWLRHAQRPRGAQLRDHPLAQE